MRLIRPDYYTIVATRMQVKKPRFLAAFQDLFLPFQANDLLNSGDRRCILLTVHYSITGNGLHRDIMILAQDRAARKIDQRPGPGCLKSEHPDLKKCIGISETQVKIQLENSGRNRLAGFKEGDPRCPRLPENTSIK